MRQGEVIQRFGVEGRGNSKCKDAGAGICLTFFEEQ